MFNLEMQISVCVSTSEVAHAPFIAEALVTDFDSSLASCRFVQSINCLYTGPKLTRTGNAGRHMLSRRTNISEPNFKNRVIFT
jgi:hypothetical protein